MPAIFAAILVLWAIFGSPKKDVADLLYANKVAPWEKVDVFFYPDKNDLARYLERSDLQSIDQCRWWANMWGRVYKDPNMERSTYECGVGRLQDKYGTRVYRITAQ